jgi:hypothetical protein
MSGSAGGRGGLIELAIDGRQPLASRSGLGAMIGIEYSYGRGEEARIVELFGASCSPVDDQEQSLRTAVVIVTPRVTWVTWMSWLTPLPANTR